MFEIVGLVLVQPQQDWGKIGSDLLQDNYQHQKPKHWQQMTISFVAHGKAKLKGNWRSYQVLRCRPLFVRGEWTLFLSCWFKTFYFCLLISYFSFLLAYSFSLFFSVRNIPCLNVFFCIMISFHFVFKEAHAFSPKQVMVYP